jgi:hypothetical protein
MEENKYVIQINSTKDLDGWIFKFIQLMFEQFENDISIGAIKNDNFMLTHEDESEDNREALESSLENPTFILDNKQGRREGTTKV